MLAETQLERPLDELLLASTSPYRAQLLARLGVPFESSPPDCDESPLPGETPAALVRRLSRQKAESLAPTASQRFIIGSDQVADLDGQALGKPGTAARAREQLSACSGRTVVFRTGLCLLDTAIAGQQIDVVDVHVRFRTLSAGDIARYVAIDAPLDCAGSIRSEGLGISLFDAMLSDDPTALVGLPLIRLCQMLRSAGVEIP